MGLSQEGCAEQRKELCVPPLLMMTPFVGGERFFFQEQCTAGACVLSESPISVSFPSGMNKLQFGNFF